MFIFILNPLLMVLVSKEIECTLFEDREFLLLFNNNLIHCACECLRLRNAGKIRRLTNRRRSARHRLVHQPLAC